MGIIQVRHIALKLNDLYREKIDVTDGHNDEEKENLFHTRAFAAYSLQVLAGVSIDIAVNSIVDGPNDNGIDAIYFDRKKKILWLIQSKWFKNGIGEPDTGETHKFKAGVLSLIDFELESFNDKVQSKQKEIEDALNDYEVKINIILSYTGGDSFSVHNKRIIDDLLSTINDSSEIATFFRFTTSLAHKSLAGLLDGQPIKAEIAIENWGKVDEPYQAVYGSVNGTYFAQLWRQYRGRLFNENIREFLGKSSVNDSMRDTITNEPHNFFYYNNGITILCQNFVKKPLVSGRGAGQFEVNDLKIVNGAQTVGCIGASYEQNPEAVESINVFTKIISLENSEDGLANNITQNTNTQNKIEKRDFVSLDPQQERLKTELALEGITYQVKRSADNITGDKQCTVEDLITAVACSLKDVDLSVLAKREVGKLWENINATPYTDIINENLSATKAWRCIVIMNHLGAYIKEKSKLLSGRERMCLIHSNRFILHMILNNIDLNNLMNPQYDFEDFCSRELDSIIDGYESRVFLLMEKLYKQSLVHQIFRNSTKCKELKAQISK